MKNRILRINKLIKQELNRLLLSEVDIPKNCLVTITAVETSRDLHYANVWLSVLPSRASEIALKKLNCHLKHLQFLLNKRLVMKPLPKLHFRLDQSEAEAAKIEGLLDNLKRKS